MPTLTSFMRMSLLKSIDGHNLMPAVLVRTGPVMAGRSRAPRLGRRSRRRSQLVSPPPGPVLIVGFFRHCVQCQAHDNAVRATPTAVPFALGSGTLSITFVAPSNGPAAQAIFDLTGYFVPGS